MSWGDPMDKFYRDEKGTKARLAALVKEGFVPGALIKLGPTLSSSPTGNVILWHEAGWDADTFIVSPGIATIVTIDCESDPTEEWILLLMSVPEGQVFGWAPSGTLRLA